VGLRPFACCQWVFESHRRDVCLSVLNVLCCQVEVSASDHSSGGALPRVLCLISGSFVKQEAMTGIRAEAQQIENKYVSLGF